MVDIDDIEKFDFSCIEKNSNIVIIGGNNVNKNLLANAIRTKLQEKWNEPDNFIIEEFYSDNSKEANKMKKYPNYSEYLKRKVEEIDAQILDMNKGTILTLFCHRDLKECIREHIDYIFFLSIDKELVITEIYNSYFNKMSYLQFGRLFQKITQNGFRDSEKYDGSVFDSVENGCLVLNVKSNVLYHLRCKIEHVVSFY